MGVTGASVYQLPAATISTLSTMGSGGGNHVIRVTGSVTLCISAPEKECLTTIKSSTGTLEIFYSFKINVTLGHWSVLVQISFIQLGMADTWPVYYVLCTVYCVICILCTQSVEV